MATAIFEFPSIYNLVNKPLKATGGSADNVRGYKNEFVFFFLSYNTHKLALFFFSDKYRAKISQWVTRGHIPQNNSCMSIKYYFNH